MPPKRAVKPLSFLAPFILLLSTLTPIMTMADDDEDQLLALMNLLNEETEIATKNKMNADFVPGMVTILHGSKLKTLGVQTIGEALNLVPGFYTTTGNTGHVVSIVRGIGSALNGSNIKVLLNGVAVNSAADGTATAILHLPIYHVERIEVIRGPGSSLYGEFAFSGVVNIITRSDSQSVHAKTGRHHYQQFDAILGNNHDLNSDNNNTPPISWTLNISKWDSRNSGRQSGPDNFSDQNFGYASGEIYDHQQGRMLLLNTHYADYHFLAQYIDRESGNYYGRTAKTPSELRPRDESTLTLKIQKEWTINNQLAITLSPSFQKNTLDKADNLGIPAGPMGPNGQLLLTDNFDRDGHNNSLWKFESSLSWKATKHNQWLLGVEYSDYKLESAYRELFELDNNEAIINSRKKHLTQAIHRRLKSIILQDQWKLTDDVELTFGARYDDYSDWGHNTSPRAAIVWRASSQHLFKAQYSEAFRPPTLSQSYISPLGLLTNITNDSLTSEDLSSLELSYVYRLPKRTLKATLFQTKVSSLLELSLIPGSPPSWENVGHLKTYGLELEWAENFSHELSLFANASYTNSSDKDDADGHITGEVAYLANIGFNWHQTPQLTHGILAKYIGSQEGAELFNLRTPHKSKFDAYYLIDYTLSYDKVFGNPDLTLQASIKNIANEEYAVQSSPTQWPEGLPQGERAWALSIAYELP